jgi:molybdopterin biosynthesis enzyme
MDVEAMARAQRRRQANEALEFERDREAALQEQLEAVVADVEGPRIDEAAFAGMAPEDAELARGILESGLEADQDLDPLDEEWLVVGDTPEEESESFEVEVSRLQAQIAESRRLQQALESYLHALGD